MLKKARAAEKTFLVLYADMNNLKIINDRYGHEEGDYSLHTIAEILAEIVQKEQTGDGVVARIGGDEYACALMTEKKKNCYYRSYTMHSPFGMNRVTNRIT